MDPFVFILGRGRSGTTLVRAILDSHPDLSVADESHFIVRLATRRRRYERASFDEAAFWDDLARTIGFRRWRLDETIVRQSLQGTDDYPDAIRRVYGVYAQREGKLRFGDKTPIYVLHIDRLAHLFPEAIFIHVIRDGRNACLSYMNLDFGPPTLPEAAIYWKRFVTAGRRAGARLDPSRYLEVRYEELVRDPETVTRSLCAFASLSFDDAMLRYFERAQQIVGATSHYRNIYRPPTKDIRDWRTEMSRSDVAVFEALAGDLLTELGYEPALESIPWRARVNARVHWSAFQAGRLLRNGRKKTGLLRLSNENQIKRRGYLERNSIDPGPFGLRDDA